MKIELLYFEGCPNWREAELVLHQALDRTAHHDVLVDLVRIATPEEAETHRFIGSPTVLIDGRDPFASGGESFAMACRVFTTPDGSAGFPSIDMLTEALS